MYMERIEVKKRAAARQRSVGAKLVAGLAFLAMSAIVAPVWFLACAAWFAVGALARGITAIFVQAWRTTLWAGEVVVGR